MNAPANSLVLAEQRQQPVSLLIPIDQVERMAHAVAKSGLFGMKNVDQAMALMLIAQAEGLHPATAAQEYDVINGRPARKTHSVLARFQASGGTVEWKALTEKEATAVFSHPSGGSVEIKWTLEMATKAGLAGKDVWKAYPRAMLRSRCVAEGVRTVFPGAIGGMLVVEEAQDMDQPGHPRVIQGEVTGNRAEPEPLPPYDADDFKVNLPKWRAACAKAVAGGKTWREAAAFKVGQVQSKYTLTEEQIRLIREEPAATATEPEADPATTAASKTSDADLLGE